MSAPSATSDPGAVRNAVRDVLAGDEFKELEPHWYDRIAAFFSDPVGTILELIQDVINYFLGGLVDGASQTWVAVIIGMIVVAVVVFAVFRLTRSVQTDEGAPVSFAPGFGTQTADELDTEAAQFEREGMWRLALRSRYAALLTRLSDQGLVRPRPGRTTGEYRQELQASAPHADNEFGEATSLFEWVWYGDREAEARDCERMRTLSRRVLQTVNA